jgi:hypothetical protein
MNVSIQVLHRQSFIWLNQLDPPLLPLAAASLPNTSEAVAQI